jgi:2-oxoglutarate dehydrogenase E2 component (dihydrolipoamide succinyltransferase)
MPLVDLIMPKLGESIMEATILKWNKQPGEAVKQDETILEIATDKVDSEIPSTTAGILEEILFKVNDVVPVGTVIAKIRNDVSETGASAPTVAAPVIMQENAFQPSSSGNGQHSGTNKNTNKFYSPLVLNIAANEGVSLSDLERIAGTGNEGRVTKKDILDYVALKKSNPANEQEASPSSYRAQEIRVIPESESYGTLPARQITTHGGNVEIIEMDRMRKLIAEHMVRSKHTSAHVTSFTEADVTNLVMWRERVKKEFEKRESTKITYTPLFIEAVVRCIKKYPIINSSVDGDKIIIKKDINIGMATVLQNGNLIVPIIRNADQLNLVGLAKQVNGLAENARSNKLRPEDTQGGTFTLTNVGTFGSLMGTPIINQPQVAILAVGAIKKRPVVIETTQGDSIAIRHMMYLSLSYDHRIVDGSLGATFLTAVANELENFNPSRDF